MNKDTHYTAFNEKWFEKNQLIVLFVFRIIYKLFPSLLFKSQETKDFGNKKIVKVGTNYATCLVGKRELKTVFFSDWNYSKMLYEAFKPMWWAMHYWDELVADKVVPSLSFGFSTLEVNPDADPETDTVDGGVRQTYVPASAVSWATIRAAAGDSAYPPDNYANGGFYIDTNASNLYKQLRRMILLFKTSDLTAGATISNSVFSVHGVNNGKSNTWATPGTSFGVGLVSSNPASNTALDAGDYDSLGSTRYCDTDVTYNGWNNADYNAYTLNATGISNIAKTGITKLGLRYTCDIDNAAPNSEASVDNYVDFCFSDNGSNKPKLVVTYTLASGGGEAGLLLRNCQ